MSNILALSETYMPYGGGHVVWLHNLCRRMGDVRVLTGKRPELARRETIDGVDVCRINLSRCPILRPESLWLYVNFQVQTIRRCLAKRPEVIIASRVLPEGLVSTRVGRLLRIPTIVIAHGEEITCWGGQATRNRRRLTSAMKRRSLWRTYHRADKIVANSRYTQDLLLSGGMAPEKVALIHPGTDVQQYSPADKDGELLSQWGLEGKRVVLSVGTLKDRKGQAMTVRAMPEILRAVPNAMYVIVGGGAKEAEIRQVVKTLGLESKVVFAGKIRTELLPKAYNIADVFIMANRQLPESHDVEGFGIVFLEASACQVPVIGGRSGGVPDAIADGQTGLLVDGSDPMDIARAVIRVLTDSDLADRFGRAGRDRVCRSLTWDHSARQMTTAIDSLVRNKDDGN